MKRGVWKQEPRFFLKARVRARVQRDKTPFRKNIFASMLNTLAQNCYLVSVLIIANNILDNSSSSL